MHFKDSSKWGLYTFGVMQVEACINVDIFVAHGWWLLMVTDNEFIYKACHPLWMVSIKESDRQKGEENVHLL